MKENIFILLEKTPQEILPADMLDTIDAQIEHLNRLISEGADKVSLTAKIEELSANRGAFLENADSAFTQSAEDYAKIIREKEYADIIEKLKNRVAMMSENGIISSKNLAILSEEFNIPAENILSAMGLREKKEKAFNFIPQDVPLIFRDDFISIEQKLRTASQNAGTIFENLYDFIGATPLADADKIKECVKSTYEKYNKDGNTGEEIVLCGISNTILCDEKMRLSYDRTRAETFFESVKDRLHGLHSISANQYDKLLAECNRKGFDKDMSEYYIRTKCLDDGAEILEPLETISPSENAGDAVSMSAVTPKKEGAAMWTIISIASFFLIALVGTAGYFAFSAVSNLISKDKTVLTAKSATKTKGDLQAVKKDDIVAEVKKEEPQKLLLPRSNIKTFGIFSDSLKSYHVSMNLSRGWRNGVEGECVLTLHHDGAMQNYKISGSISDEKKLSLKLKSQKNPAESEHSFDGIIKDNSISGKLTGTNLSGNLMLTDVSKSRMRMYSGKYTPESSSDSGDAIFQLYFSGNSICGAARFLNGKSVTDYSVSGNISGVGMSLNLFTISSSGKKLSMRLSSKSSGSNISGTYMFYSNNRYSNKGSFDISEKK